MPSFENTEQKLAQTQASVTPSSFFNEAYEKGIVATVKEHPGEAALLAASALATGAAAAFVGRKLILNGFKSTVDELFRDSPKLSTQLEESNALRKMAWDRAPRMSGVENYRSNPALLKEIRAIHPVTDFSKGPNLIRALDPDVKPPVAPAKLQPWLRGTTIRGGY